MLTQRYLGQQVPLSRKIHNSLRCPNPPNPRHPRSIISQNEFANGIARVGKTGYKQCQYDNTHQDIGHDNLFLLFCVHYSIITIIRIALSLRYQISDTLLSDFRLLFACMKHGEHCKAKLAHRPIDLLIHWPTPGTFLASIERVI